MNFGRISCYYLIHFFGWARCRIIPVSYFVQCRIFLRYRIIFEIFVENTILDLSVIVLIRKWLFATVVLIRYWNTPLSYFSKKKFGDSSIVFIGQCRIFIKAGPVSYFSKKFVRYRINGPVSYF